MTDFILIEVSSFITRETKNNEIINVWNSLNIPIPSNEERKSSPFMDNIATNSEGSHYISSVWFMVNYVNIKKIWLNPKNGYVIAYEDNDGYKFSTFFIEHLNYIEPVNIYMSSIKVHLSIDSILDKISVYGINSLTNEEKTYLDSVI
jgi:hypothetical protein